MKEWAGGRDGLKMNQDIHIEIVSKGIAMMRYGFSSFGVTEEGNIETIKAALVDFEAMVKQYPEYIEMEKFNDRLVRLKKSIYDVVTTVLLRRIVPGRCKYCPI